MSTLPGTLREDFEAQRDFTLPRAPVYGRLFDILLAQLDRGLEARLEQTWRGRRFGAFYERPLLVAAALRDDALREGPAHPLWSGIAGPVPDARCLDERRVAEAVDHGRSAFWETLARRHVQTNETSRAVAWLWPAAIAARAGVRRPIALHDVGTSAGLHLVADRLPMPWEREDGAPLLRGDLPEITTRIGFDLRPLDVHREEDARWLRACVWPGQIERETRLEAAIGAFRAWPAGSPAPAVRSASATDVPALLPRGEDGALAIVCQTIMRDYLEAAERDRYESDLRRWLTSRPRGSALWVELELVPEAARSAGPPAAITAHLRTGTGLRSLVLARCEPHPSRLAIDEAAVQELAVGLEPAAATRRPVSPS